MSTVAPAVGSAPLLEVRGLQKSYAARGPHGARRPVAAARDVGFSLRRGEALALVGESGSGKSTIARLLLRLEQPDGGQILWSGEDVLAREPRQASLDYRGRVQMVFQDPFGSLNPVHRVSHHLIRPLLRHAERNARGGARLNTAAAARPRALDLLRTVGLEPAEDFIDRYPHELSGGQRQRVAIARALAVEPELLVADEPTSMLDVSIRMGILNLLASLKRERGLAILLITHDLASARYLADRVLVLYRGRLVEDGPSDDVVNRPAHPYSQALLASIAGASPGSPAAAAPPRTANGASAGNGCPFASRCTQRVEPCLTSDPAPRRFDHRLVRCHLYPASAPESPQ